MVHDARRVDAPGGEAAAEMRGLEVRDAVRARPERVADAAAAAELLLWAGRDFGADVPGGAAGWCGVGGREHGGLGVSALSGSESGAGRGFHPREL